ncbi:hypothetical protein [Aurantimicrobium minutum]|uniref:Two-component response regulator n=1 Tax=Aurantimicrobium minutum TaxID=708131 RepID=A0A173LXK5_9MICO|nr:hypothetical protein [Aurantimicrobium minutum]BAU99630.1 two-component response regulator [Aurantimicrobium minutum]
MSFVEQEKKVITQRKDAAERLDAYLNTLDKPEKEAAIRILLNASQKKAMDTFRHEGYPISYVTLTNWRERHHGV